jgi:hypothetical protein
VPLAFLFAKFLLLSPLSIKLTLPLFAQQHSDVFGINLFTRNQL